MVLPRIGRWQPDAEQVRMRVCVCAVATHVPSARQNSYIQSVNVIDDTFTSLLTRQLMILSAF